jgi:hypothetical protein
LLLFFALSRNFAVFAWICSPRPQPMRYIDLREILELTFAGLIGLAAAFIVLEHHRHIIPHGITSQVWLAMGAGAGLLLAIVWSAWKVSKRIDKRLPRHLRPRLGFGEGRPVGVAAWKTKDAASEYLWLLLGVGIVLVIIWLAKTYVP